MTEHRPEDSPTPEDGPDVPGRAPDTRTRTIRADWWRTATPWPVPAPRDVPQRDAAEEQPEQPAGAAAPSDEKPDDAPEQEPDDEGPRSRLGRMRHLMTKGLGAGQEEPADEDDEGQDDEEHGRGAARSRPTADTSEDDEDDEDDEDQDDDPSRGAGRRPYWGGGAQRPEGPLPGRPARQSFAEWWWGRTREQRFLLTNGTAAAAGAYGPGMFSGRWDIGIPQLILSAMHDAAEQYADPATPLTLGGFAVLGATLAGGIVAGFFLRFFAAVPTMCRVLHWLFVRVPVASSIVAVLLFTTR